MQRRDFLKAAACTGLSLLGGNICAEPSLVAPSEFFSRYKCNEVITQVGAGWHKYKLFPIADFTTVSEYVTGTGGSFDEAEKAFYAEINRKCGYFLYWAAKDYREISPAYFAEFTEKARSHFQDEPLITQYNDYWIATSLKYRSKNLMPYSEWCRKFGTELRLYNKPPISNHYCFGRIGLAILPGKSVLCARRAV